MERKNGVVIPGECSVIILFVVVRARERIMAARKKKAVVVCGDKDGGYRSNENGGEKRVRERTLLVFFIVAMRCYGYGVRKKKEEGERRLGSRKNGWR